MDASSLGLKYQVYLPADLIMVFKSIMTLEGMARDMDPDFDLVEAGAKYAKDVIKNLYSVDYLTKELVFTVRDSWHLIRHWPRQFTEITRQLECGDFKVNLNIDQIKELKDGQIKAQALVAQSVLAFGLLMVAAIVSTQLVLPTWALVIIWLTSLTFSGWVSFKSRN